MGKNTPHLAIAGQSQCYHIVTISIGTILDSSESSEADVVLKGFGTPFCNYRGLIGLRFPGVELAEMLPLCCYRSGRCKEVILDFFGKRTMIRWCLIFKIIFATIWNVYEHGHKSSLWKNTVVRSMSLTFPQTGADSIPV